MANVAIKLTEAQVSALECAGFECDDTPSLAALSWQGRRMVFAAADRDRLYSEVNELSNDEDARAIETGDIYARRASRALGNLASKILRG